MCQACVDAGCLTQETFDKIEAFVEEHEQSSFGPAHSVLDDSNVDDEDIYYCLRTFYAIFPEDAQSLPEIYTKDISPEFEESLLYFKQYYELDEMHATMKFLEGLLEIPEAQR